VPRRHMGTPRERRRSPQAAAARVHAFSPSAATAKQGEVKKKNSGLSVTGSEIPSRTHPRSPKIRPFQRRRGHAARAGTAEPLPRISLSLLPPCDQRHMHRKDLIFESGVAPSDLLGTSRNRSVSSRTLATARSPLELWLIFFFKVSGLFFLSDRWSSRCVRASPAVP